MWQKLVWQKLLRTQATKSIAESSYFKLTISALEIMQSNIRSALNPALKTVALLLFAAAIALLLTSCRAGSNSSVNQVSPGTRETAGDASLQPGGCVTLISDPQSPIARVFSNPEEQSSDVLAELENGAEVTVIGYQNGWLQISTPVTGWVFLGATTVSCGDAATIQTVIDNVNFLKERSIGGDRLAADTLVRYAFQADGAGAEVALGAIVEWAQTNPEFLITVLNEQPQSVRNGVLSLLKFSLSPDAQSTFEAALSEQDSDSPTARAWHRGDRPSP
jgi:hypothetical protein